MRRPTVAIFAGAVVLGLVLAGVLTRGGSDPGALPPGQFRVAVDEILHHDEVLVTCVAIEAHPATTIRVVADRQDRGGLSLTNGPSGPDGVPPKARVTVFADHLGSRGGSVDAVKFVLELKGGRARATTSIVRPVTGVKRLADICAVAIAPGLYPHGKPTKLLTYRDLTYSLVVEERP